MNTLLEDVQTFIAANEMSESRFGVESLKDKNFVRQLRGGRKTWPDTERKVRTYMASYRGSGK